MKRRLAWPLLGAMLCAGAVLVLLPARNDDHAGSGLPTLDIPASRTAAASLAAHESWQVIQLDGQRIGSAYMTTRIAQEQGRRVVRTESELRMAFKRFGQSVEMHKMLRTEETEAGDLLSFEMELRNPPAAPTRSVGRVEGGRLVVETTLAGRTQTKSLDWQPGTKSPLWQERLLRESPLRPRETRSFQAFVPDFGKTTTVRISADDYQFIRLLDGRQRKLLKLRVTQSVAPTLTTRAWVDESGVPVRTEDDLGGMTIVAHQVDRAEALKQLAGADLDIAVSTLVPVTPITDAHRTTRAVYRVTLLGDDPARYLMESATQSVKRISSETVELTVTAPVLPRELKKTAAEPEYMGATQFLQSDDARVIEHVRRAAAGQTDPRRIAVAMEEYVHQRLSRKNFSTALASAAEVAQTLEGDCTEHAVLLAAMLRAKKIPSRVAVGLVYVESASSFGGHMWTEAWLGGEWYPLDATLGRGGIGAAHIKMADSSLADDAPAPVTSFLPLLKVLGRVRIEVIEAR